MHVCGHRCDMSRRGVGPSFCCMLYMDSRQPRVGDGGEPAAVRGAEGEEREWERIV